MLASTTGPDVLAVIDQTNATITALQANPPAILANITLVTPPLAAVIRKRRFYIVTENPPVSGSPATFSLQAFDLKKLLAGAPELPPDGAPSVAPASPTAMATDGHEAFVIGAAAAAGATDNSRSSDFRRGLSRSVCA